MRTLALAALLATPACLFPPDNDVIQFEDDFEACDDLCGWTVSGDVRRESTYHAGEHALVLGPGATATHDLGISRAGSDGSWGNMNDSDGNWLELSTDCFGPGALELRAAGPDRYAIEVDLDDDALGRFARHRVNFPPVAPEVGVTFATLALRGSGLECRVDNVQIRISGGEYGY